MWKTKTVKRAGRHSLRKNYFVCFIACLAFVFIVVGPMSISNAITTNEDTLRSLADTMPGTSVAALINDTIDEVDTFKEDTSLGDTATGGITGDAYRRISQAGGVTGLISTTINTVVAGGKLSTISIGLLTFVLAALIYIFIGGVLEFGLARFFLETRINPDTRLSRIFFIYRARRTRRAAFIIFTRTLYLILWTLTIIGLPIKYYSYRLIPHLVAENPDITRREAFALSKTLMKGNKFRMFLFDLSFLPWMLLAIPTFGILNYAWLNPYYYASRAEVFAEIRGMGLALSEPAAIRGPGKLSSLLSHVGAKPTYSFINLAMLFLFFSIFGWVFECVLTFFTEGVLVNRGTMYGPWIPIYGVGGLVIILLVNRFNEKPLVCFFMIIAVCAPIEYLGALLLWETRHLKYWDYSGYFLNIQGRICLDSMLNFAIMGLLGIYILAPIMDSLFERIPLKTRKTICVVLYSLFCIDLAAAHLLPRTGKGITDN